MQDELMAVEEALKAFAVTENDESMGGIVFAKSAIAARRMGANQYADGEFAYVSCRRAKWADHCAETGIVPASLMIECGWHFECGSCGERVDSDWLYENDRDPEDVIGTQHSTVYCTPLCEARERLSRAEAKHRETRWIRRFRKIILRRFPGVTICTDERTFKGSGHAYCSFQQGKWRMRQVSVAFEFPGMVIAPAALRWDRDHRHRVGRPSKPHWSVCNGDKDAFEAFALRSGATLARSDEGAGK